MTTGRINQVAFLVDAGVARARPSPEGPDGSGASAAVVRREAVLARADGGEDPVPAEFAASESPGRRSRTTTSLDGARRAWDARAASWFAPRARSARGEVRLVARGNAWALGMQHRKPASGKPGLRLPLDWDGARVRTSLLEQGSNLTARAEHRSRAVRPNAPSMRALHRPRRAALDAARRCRCRRRRARASPA